MYSFTNSFFHSLRTGWLEHLRMILRGAKHTVRVIHVQTLTFPFYISLFFGFVWVPSSPQQLMQFIAFLGLAGSSICA